MCLLRNQTFHMLKMAWMKFILIFPLTFKFHAWHLGLAELLDTVYSFQK